MENNLNSIVEQLSNDESQSRRSLATTLVKGAVLTAAAGILVQKGRAQSTITDADILNFALNLEYLEAEFYTYATKGHGIQAEGVAVNGTGNAGNTTGGVQTNFTDARIQAVANDIADDERQHVLYIRNALGSAAVAKPQINLAALGTFDTQAKFLALARAFEDVGVSAYSGAAKLIQSKTVLDVAARILATEAMHSGNIRLSVAMNNINSSAVDSQDVPPPPSGSKYFTVDSKALAIERTTRAVLDIVYAGGSSSGGFFPAGFNGTIKS